MITIMIIIMIVIVIMITRSQNSSQAVGRNRSSFEKNSSRVESDKGLEELCPI